MRRSAVSAGRSDSRNRLESGGNRVNMLTRRFAFVPPLRGNNKGSLAQNLRFT